MPLSFDGLNWLAIAACVVVGQGFLTVWFVALFADPWAKAYGAKDKKEHTKAIPGYTYGIGVACMFLLVLGLATLEAGLGVAGAVDGAMFGLFVAVCLCVATATPGYAFLKRWNAYVLAVGSQTVLIVILSVILAVWR